MSAPSIAPPAWLHLDEIVDAPTRAEASELAAALAAIEANMTDTLLRVFRLVKRIDRRINESRRPLDELGALPEVDSVDSDSFSDGLYSVVGYYSGRHALEEAMLRIVDQCHAAIGETAVREERVPWLAAERAALDEVQPS